MSYTNGTTHYNLPLTTGADKRDWSDTNQAFSDVDAALYGAVQDTAQAELDIDALETRMDTAEQNISTNTGNIAGLDTRVTTVEGAVTSLSGQVTDTRQDLEDMICAYNEASATSTHAYAIGDYFIYNDVLYKATQVIAIGDTIVPDTNCSTTNVTSELGSKNVVIGSASTDGVKTFGALALELFNIIRSATEYHSNKFNFMIQCVPTAGNFYYFTSNMLQFAADQYSFSATLTGGNLANFDVSIDTMIFANNSATYARLRALDNNYSGTPTWSTIDRSSTVPAAGSVYRVIATEL